jgi:hypothetical protein
MRRVFPLNIPDRKAPLVLAAIKNEVRKYLKRERRKVLPEGVDFWDFDCQVGPDREHPKSTHPGDLISALDAAAEADWPEVYVEILAKPGRRTAKPASEGNGDRD